LSRKEYFYCLYGRFVSNRTGDLIFLTRPWNASDNKHSQAICWRVWDTNFHNYYSQINYLGVKVKPKVIILFKNCEDYLQNYSLTQWVVQSRKLQHKNYMSYSKQFVKIRSLSNGFNFLPNFLAAKDQASINKR